MKPILNYVTDVKGCILTEDVNVKKQDSKHIKIKGLLLPKDKVSRNGVLYDWDSIKEKYKDLIGKSVLYNHLGEGAEKPLGHVTDTWIKESDDDEGRAGWYYEANINPNSKYADSILRGDISKVSIQLMAAKAKTEKNDDGDTYKRAFVGSIMEMSLVTIPGFEDTTMEVALAEAFRTKESGQTTANNPGSSQVVLQGKDKDKEKEINYIATDDDLDDYSQYYYDKDYKDLTERQQTIIRTKARKHGPFSEKFSESFGIFPFNEFVVRLAQRIDSLGTKKHNYNKVMEEANSTIIDLKEEVVIDKEYVERVMRD